MLRCRPHRSAFSLIELLVVVSIIAVLASLTMPIIGMVRFSAKVTVCSNNLRSLTMACLGYAADHDDRVDMRRGGSHWGNGGTWAETMWSVQGGYLDSKSALACPDAWADGTTPLRKFLGAFDFNDEVFTVFNSYYMHAGSWFYPDEDMAPGGPSADLGRTGGWIKTLAQATSRDALLCEWSRVWTPAQEGPYTYGTHLNHWRGGRPRVLNVGWFDGHVSKAREQDIYPLYDYWVISGAAEP